MNAIENAIKFLEEIVIECEPNTGCGRCDDARKVVEDLRGLSNSNNKPLVKADVSGSLLLEQDNDIDVVGNCPNCGVEFHIHKQ